MSVSHESTDGFGLKYLQYQRSGFLSQGPSVVSLFGGRETGEAGLDRFTDDGFSNWESENEVPGSPDEILEVPSEESVFGLGTEDPADSSVPNSSVVF